VEYDTWILYNATVVFLCNSCVPMQQCVPMASLMQQLRSYSFTRFSKLAFNSDEKQWFKHSKEHIFLTDTFSNMNFTKHERIKRHCHKRVICAILGTNRMHSWRVFFPDEDGIGHVIYTVQSKNGQRQYVVEAKNGKYCALFPKHINRYI
jgi:hypothetical protein